jgi:hypothetical protein
VAFIPKPTFYKLFKGQLGCPPFLLSWRAAAALQEGTRMAEDEPQLDGLENPWTDLWFYSNPVFIDAT